MPYYANAKSKANQFCVETAQAIRHFLETQRGGDLRAPFIARDLTEAGILIPKGGLRLLRNRDWIQRLEATASSPRRSWRLSESARRWLEEQGGTYPPEAV
ncbi:MAG: hypothetical protein WC277_12660 [Bacilli bacterium]|jgi:hypothetical protein